jgi:hypothetical protein
VRPTASLDVSEKRTISFTCWELNKDTNDCVIEAATYQCLAGLCYWNWLRVKHVRGLEFCRWHRACKSELS